MAIDVKPVAEVSKKWGDITAQRGGYYEAGASNAGAKQNAKAIEAAANYKAAVSASNIDKLFTGGLKAAGAEKYNRKVKDVGVQRFGPGVQAAVKDYNDAVQPYLETIASVPLPARLPRATRRTRPAP